MYLLEGTGTLEEPWFEEDIFNISPADSLITFELPPSLHDEDYQPNGLNFNSDVFINSAHSDSNLTNLSPGLFDFVDIDIDKTDNFDDYLFETLNYDRSNDSPEYSFDNVHSDNALGRLSVLGIELDSMCNETKVVEQPDKCVEKKPYLGEPIYCPEHQAFRCPVESCGRLYAKASHVRAHLRRHSGEKPFRCTWSGCAWRFARSDELARHKRSHSGDKPYGCTECGKRFARSDHLAKHGRVHARRAAAAAAAAASIRRIPNPRKRRLLL